MDDEFIIEAKGVSKYYQIGKQRITALKDVNLQISLGEFIGIYGPSGSGKTTLLQLLGLLETPSEGYLEVFGHSVADLTSKRKTILRQTSIGMIFQSAALLSRFTALENVEMPLIARDPPINEIERLKMAKEVLELVGLPDKHDSFPDQLSGGQRQRVAVARALINDPKILLADEPTGDLDSYTGEHIVKLLRQLPLSGNRTVVMVTHDDSYFDQFDNILSMQDGRISI